MIEPVDPRAAAVTRPGDLWICGSIDCFCADATVIEGYFTLMERDKAQIVFTDQPYNVPNAGHVTKREGVAEFAMAAGEMSKDQFTAFLSARESATSATGCRRVPSASSAWTGGTFRSCRPQPTPCLVR